MIIFRIEQLAIAPTFSPFNGLPVATATVIAAADYASDLVGQQIEVVDHCSQRYGPFAEGAFGAAMLSVWESLAVGDTGDTPSPAHWATVAYDPSIEVIPKVHGL